MPQLGETVADGTVTKWFKKVGDVVQRGEPLFEVSTDKVDTEIPSPVDGTITEILVQEGETVDVGTVLAVIGGRGAVGPTATSVEALLNEVRTPAVPSSPPGALSPVVRRLLADNGLDAAHIVGTGPQGRLTRDDVLAAVGPEAAGALDAGAVPHSPVVRRLLRVSGLDPASLVATGPNGRLTRGDVEAAAAHQRGAEVADDEVIAFTRIRRLTAEHMTRSKATSAHTLMVREVDFERVEEVRRSYGSAFKESEGFTLTYLPFIAVSVIAALREFPHLNASVGEDVLVVHREVNLGIAVDLDGQGLVVPVLHHAGGYDLRSMARKIRDVASSARTKKLTVDDTARGTFTITNPGPYGTLLTGAIINQPQVAILATDGVARKPVVVVHEGAEAIVIHSVGLLALTFDHRVIDGAYAARFLLRTAEILHERDWSAAL